MADDEVNLYDDLLINEEEDRIEVQNRKAEQFVQLEAENVEQKARISELEAQKKSLTKQNDILRRNISVLYKTARAEIDRKDILLKELQRKYDEIIFRRITTGPKFVGGHPRSIGLEVQRGALTSQHEGNASKTLENEPVVEGLRRPVWPEVARSTVESKPLLKIVERTASDAPFAAEQASEATVASKTDYGKKLGPKIGSVSGLTDRERTLAHFNAKIEQSNRIQLVKCEKSIINDDFRKSSRSTSEISKTGSRESLVGAKSNRIQLVKCEKSIINDDFRKSSRSTSEISKTGSRESLVGAKSKANSSKSTTVTRNNRTCDGDRLERRSSDCRPRDYCKLSKPRDRNSRKRSRSRSATRCDRTGSNHNSPHLSHSRFEKRR